MEGEKIISYLIGYVRVNCDRKCNKAWGMSQRPKIELSDDVDDYVFLADGELDDAPVDPGTYEGGDGKPESPSMFPNKWCLRECERCRMIDADDASPLKLIDFSQRRYNLASRESEL